MSKQPKSPQGPLGYAVTVLVSLLVIFELVSVGVHASSGNDTSISINPLIDRPTVEPVPRSTLTPFPRSTLTPLSNVGDTLFSLNGVAFHDFNANGQRDAGEPPFGGAWVKITGGGNWYVCTATNGDGLYDIMVQPGIYYVVPIGLKGYRVTTSILTATVPVAEPLTNYVGYVRDGRASLQACDQYHP